MTGATTAARSVSVLACGAFVLGALCACGGDAKATDPTTAHLQADVLALTRAAAAGNDVGAEAALLTLTRDVSAARAAGTISAARVRRLDADITAVTADLHPAATATPTRSASTPSPTAVTRTVVVPGPAPTAAGSKKAPNKTPKAPSKPTKKTKPPHKHGPAG